MTAIVPLNAIGKALAEARTIEELLQIRDQAEAVRGWARNATRSVEHAREIANHAAEYKIRAERRLGQELERMPKHPPGPQPEDRSHDVTDPPKLADLGGSKMQSSRWQAIAQVPDEVFAKRIAYPLHAIL